jgi:tryptophan-rich sensory protein
MTNEAAPDETAPVSVPSNDDANSTAVVEAPTSVAPSKTVPFHGDLQQLPAVRNVEMALSVDPFGLATLLQTVFLAAVKLTSATFASLQLIAPMILAKRCLQALGYIFYDHYNGRYIRNVYTKRMQHMQEFEVIASARALGRFLIQLSAMTLVGNVVAWAVLKGPQEQQSWLIPCLLQPSWVCYWWSGLLWMGLVCLTGSGVGMAMAKDGFTVKVGNIAAKNDTTNNNTAACTKFYRNPLSIRPTVMGTPATNLRKWRRNAGESPLDKIMLIPWQLLQWMKDPEESINSMFRMANYKSNYPIRASLGPKAKTIKLDTLLFPSTWRPLRIYSCLVVVQAIFETLSAPFRASDSWKSSRILRLKMMKAFLIHETTHNEWYRVFVKERRVALGAIISMIELLVLLRMMLVATWVDKLASLALIPVLIAQVVTWYMNTILYFDHYLPTARSVPAKRKKQIALV